MEQRGFEEALDNYRYGVEQVIPAYLSGHTMDASGGFLAMIEVHACAWTLIRSFPANLWFYCLTDHICDSTMIPNSIRERRPP